MNKSKVACFGLGFDQKNQIKKLSKKFNIVGFDNNTKSPGIFDTSSITFCMVVNSFPCLE